MAVRQKWIHDLAQRVSRLDGWRAVPNRATGGLKIITPEGTPYVVHNTPSDVNAEAVTMRGLGKLGFRKAEDAWKRQDALNRRMALEQDRAAGRKALATAESNAARLAKAVGYVAPDRLTAETVDGWPMVDLAWALKPTTKPESRVYAVGPREAEKLLDHNTGNRRQRKTQVEDWSEIMREGEFQLTPDAIGFDTQGVMLNGQHRLQGCVLTGRTILAIVVVGLLPKAYPVLDCGLKRSAGDALHRLGYPNEMQLGATVRLVNLARTGEPDQLRKRLSNVHVAEMVERNPEAWQFAVRYAGRIYSAHPSLGMVSTAAAVYLVRAISKAADTMDFFEGLHTGADIPRGDPRLSLMSQVDVHRKTQMRGSSPYVLALIITAWNQWNTGTAQPKVSTERFKIPAVTGRG